MDIIRDNLEKIIVASIIDNEDFFLEVSEKNLMPEDFTNPICSAIFKVSKEIFEKNIMPKKSMVEQEILMYFHEVEKQPQRVGEFMKRYKEIMSKREEDLDSLDVHLERLYEYKMRDGIVSILNNARKMADTGESKDILNYILDAYVMSFDEHKSVDGINFYDLMKRDVEKYDPYRIIDDEDRNNLSRTGIYYLDTKYLNGGVGAGSMCLIAGRPGSGKTTLLKTIGLNNARDGQKTLLVSLEMSEEQIAQGYYAQIARVNYGSILSKNVSAEDYNKMLATLDKEENKLENYHIVESDSLTISQLINLLIRYKKKHEIDVFLLDYIQQIRLDNGSVPKNEQEYSMVSELIRTIIKKLKMKAYICAQVNRDCEKRVDKRPIASDLRSSGKLEQDASYILTTYRDEYYNPLDSDHPTKHPKTMDITIAKNRFGLMGTVRVLFEGEFQNIGNLRDGDLSQSAAVNI